MTQDVDTSTDDANARYWLRIERQLLAESNILLRAVRESKAHQATAYALSPTAKTGDKQWEATLDAARRALTTARRQRTRVRKIVFAARDTMRIRPHLAAGAPADLPGKLDEAIKLLAGLEVSGF